MNFSELFQHASLEAATDEPQGKEKDMYVKWVLKQLEIMTSKNDYVWSYRIVSSDELQESDAGTSGFKYAYVMPNDVVDVKAVNPVAGDGYVPSLDYALDHSLPWDINQFIPGGVVGSAETSFQFIGSTLYTNYPASTVIGKKKFLNLSQVPSTVHQMFIKYVGAMMARRSSDGGDAQALTYEAKTIEASIAIRSLQVENLEQQLIARYLKKSYTLLTSI